MTNVIFDLVDVVGEVRPGDTVRIWPPRVTRNPEGQTVVTRPETINVGAGPATRDISPGPLWVQIQAGGYTDTEPKLVRVPEVGEFPDDVTIANLLARVEHYDPVLESWAYENAGRAEQAALDAIAERKRAEDAADLSHAGAELSEDAAAVAVAAAIGFEGHTPASVKDAATRAEQAATDSTDARDVVVPLAGQVRTDATATAADRAHVDGQVDAIDTAFTESVPPYLQPDSPGGLRATYALTEPRTVNVFHKGVSPAHSASDNQAAFQSAIDGAPDGATIVMPTTSSAERVHIGGSIVPRPGMNVSGLGGRAYLAQETWGVPVFDLPRGEVTVSHWDVLCIPEKSVVSGTFRDGSATNAAAVVWLGGHRGRLTDIRGQGFTSVCRATPWDEYAGTLGEFSDGHVFENIHVDGCDWGVVGSGWRNALVRQITGTYSTRPGSGDPGHLVYVAPQRRSHDVVITDCIATNGTGGRAYSLKNIDGLNASALSARSCEGLLDYTEIKNSRLTGLRALDDKDSSGQGCIYGFGGDENSNMHVSDVLLEIHPEARAARIDGLNGVWSNIAVIADRAVNADRFDIEIRGNGNTFEGGSVWNKSQYAFRFVGVFGTDNRIIRPRTKQSRVAITTYGGATGALVEYDPAEIDLSASGNIYSALVNQLDDATLRISPMTQRVTTAGGTVRGYSSMFSTMQVMVTGTGAVSIFSPYDRPNGHVITYEVTNTTAAPIGALSFTGTHTTNGPAAAVPPGKTNTYTFRYDYEANVWREIGRQEAAA